MKKLFVISMLLIVALSLSACTAMPNEMANTENSEGEIAGFWQGLWHGFILPFTFVVSLFNENVGLFEVYSNGGWYNFGFVFGAAIIFGGGGGGGCRAYKRR